MSTIASDRTKMTAAVCAVAMAILACNAPFAREAVTATVTPEATETATATERATIEPAQTAPQAVDEATASNPSATPQPTATTIETPTLAPTHTASPSHTPRPTSTRETVRTATPTTTSGNAGPLSFTYEINWRLKDEKATMAIATVTILATGGGGEYKYYRDDLPVDGPVFEYEWRTCQGNPGSLRVDSADGQSVRTDYFENPPCPTPTPQR
jgi:hypothetical protein